MTIESTFRILRSVRVNHSSAIDRKVLPPSVVLRVIFEYSQRFFWCNRKNKATQTRISCVSQIKYWSNTRQSIQLQIYPKPLAENVAEISWIVCVSTSSCFTGKIYKSIKTIRDSLCAMCTWLLSIFAKCQSITVINQSSMTLVMRSLSNEPKRCFCQHAVDSNPNFGPGSLSWLVTLPDFFFYISCTGAWNLVFG